MMRRATLLFFTAMLTCASSFAQNPIPNPDFDFWTTHSGYKTPDGWANPDSLGALNIPTPVYPCTQGVPGYTSSYCLQLTSKTSIIGVIPGVAGSGKLSGTFGIQSGFAISTRPQSFAGAWQYAPMGTDQGNIIVFLSKWNSALNKRDTVSFTNQPLTGSVTAWAAFTFDLNYTSGVFPDSGFILLSSGKLTGGTDGSYLYVSALRFDGSVPAGVTTINNNAAQISMFPNPAAIYTNIAYESKTSGTVTVKIIDINGKTINTMSFKKVRGKNDFPVDVSKMSVGIYLVKISDDQGDAMRKLIVE